MLSHAASHLKNPVLAEGFSIWREFWGAVKAALAERENARAARSREQREADLAASSVSARGEIEEMQREHNRKMKDLVKAQEESMKKLQAELDRVRAELQRGTADRAKEKVSQDGRLAQMSRSTAEAERQLHEQMAKEAREREQRIEHLGELFARRVLKKDLARGWVAWQEMWMIQAQRRRMLQHATNRLKNPSLVMAFSVWHVDWEAAMREKEEIARRQREAIVAGGAAALEAELDRLKKEHGKKLQSFQTTQDRLMSKLQALSGDAADAERQLQEQEAAREKSDAQQIEHLSQNFLRRLLKKELARGWTAWMTNWQDTVRRKRIMEHAASRLKNPELSEAFHVWLRDYRAVKEVQRVKAERAKWRAREKEFAGDAAGLQAEVERVTKDYEKRLAASQAAYDALMERLSRLDGGEADAARRLQEQLEKEAADREKRVEHLGEMIARRIMRKDLSRGWTAWAEAWEDAARRKRMLQQATSRLQRPGLAAALSAWKEDWHECEMQAAEAERVQRESSLTRSRADLELDLTRVQREHELKLIEMEKDKRQALEDQLMELLGSHDGEKKAQEEHAKAERVELLYRQIARRMKNQDVIRGWTSWLALWEHETHIRRCLAHSAGRLSKPALGGAFDWWVFEWEELKRQKERDRQAAKRAELEEAVRQSKMETGKLSMIQVANNDELKALRSKVGTLNDNVAAKVAALATAEDERQQLAKLIELQKATQDALSTAEKERDAAVKHAADEQVNSKKMLQQLLSEQRVSMEDEVGRSRKELTSLTSDLKQAREEVARLDKELSKLKLTQKKPEAPKKKLIVLNGEGPLTEQLAEALRANATRVLDLFRSWDADGDGEVSRAEFHKAMPALGLEVPKADVDELFNAWDKDGGGSLAYKEMRRILSGASSAPKKKMVLSGEGPLSDQLAEALRANAGRVLDLFRSWDANGDGEVSRAEFHKAVPALGLDVPKTDVDQLFNTWDKDGGGSLAYRELKKILSGAPSPTANRLGDHADKSKPGLGGAAKAMKAADGMKKLTGKKAPAASAPASEAAT